MLQAGAPDEPVEVLVCDIAMPDEDGYTTLKRIRQWEGSRDGHRLPRPAIAISAYSEREDRLRALQEGFAAYLSKPISPAELMLVIANAARAARP
jgi:CheY-like chemotaxis protein